MADQVSSFVFPENFFSEKQLPPVFNLETPAHMARFEVECKEVGERFLHRNWPHTVKVGGKIFEEIRARKPENTDIVCHVRNHQVQGDPF